jgi:hypothetical protein
VDVEDVDPVGLELGERVADRDVERAARVAAVENRLLLSELPLLVVAGVLGRDDEA